MKHKEGFLIGQWNSKAIDRKLKFLLVGIDCLTQAVMGHEITITSLKREGKGFHPKGQAADVRSKDMTKETKDFVTEVLALARKYTGPKAPNETLWTNPQFQYEFESAIKGGRGEHYHVELDDGEPIK